MNTNLNQDSDEILFLYDEELERKNKELREILKSLKKIDYDPNAVFLRKFIMALFRSYKK